MKRFFILLLIFSIFFYNFTSAKSTKKQYTHKTTYQALYSETYKAANGFGAGIVFGISSGISFKNWVSREGALQFDVSWDFHWGAIGIGVAYLFHNFKLIKVKDSLLPLYFGIKGWLGLSSHSFALGVQVPLGIVWIPKEAPIDIFLQIEPGIALIPATSFAPNAGLGIRYYF